MSKHTTVLLTVGVAGSGKSYRRCAVESFNFFRDNPTQGNFISNFPINIDVLAADLSKKYGRPVDEYKSRIIIIGRDVLKSWMIGIDANKTEIEPRGLWSYFRSIPWSAWEFDRGVTWFSEQKNFHREDLLDPCKEWLGTSRPDLVYCDNVDGVLWAAVDLQASHVSIDEIHNFCSSTGRTPKQHREKWGHFLGEIRHRGATIEFITQAESKLADEIKAEADVKLELVNAEKEREYITGIEMFYYLELAAKFTGSYLTFVYQLEYRKVNKRWEKQDNKCEKFFINPKYFKYYNSYAAPFAGAGSVEAPKHEFEKRSFLSLLYWVWINNIYRLTSKLVVLCFVVWLFLFGGLNFCIDLIMGATRNAISGSINTQLVSVSDEPVEEPLEASVVPVAVTLPAPSAAPVVPLPLRKHPVSFDPRGVPVADPVLVPASVPVPVEPVFTLVTKNWVVYGNKLYEITPLNELGILNVDMQKRRILYNSGKSVSF